MNKTIGFCVSVALTQNVCADALLNAQLQKVLGKMDPWVAVVIEGDYRKDATQTKRVKFRMVPDAQREMLTEMGLIGYTAAYRPEEDQLLIHEKWDDSVITAVSHEMWHSAYDTKGPALGLIRQAPYLGPTDEEMEAYRVALLARPSLKKALDQFDLGLTAISFKESEDKLNRSFMRKINAFKVVREAVEELDKLDSKELVFVAGYKELKKEEQAFADKYKQTKRLIKGEDGFFVRLKEAKENTAELTADLLRKLQAQLEEIFRKSEAIGELMPSAKEFARKAKEATYSAKRAFLEKDTEELKAELKTATDKVVLAILENALRSNERELEFLAELRTIEGNLGGFDSDELEDTLLEGLQGLKKNINERSITATLMNTDEVMARVVESLYAIYLGPARMNQFPLEEKDLVFLERFTFDGVPMFRKGIEKYRIALDLLAVGKDPAWIKARLEYATEYDWKGVNHSWPETKVTIQGEIPEVEK